MGDLAPTLLTAVPPIYNKIYYNNFEMSRKVFTHSMCIPFLKFRYLNILCLFRSLLISHQHLQKIV